MDCTRYEYSLKTSTTILRNHLLTIHKDAYERACKQHNWKYLQVSQDGSEAASTTQNVPRQPRAPFSSKSFLDHLIKFIIADDQVSPMRHHVF